jgi:hypothetical protein
VARRSGSSDERNASKRRIALTSAYLNVVRPGISLSTRTMLADSILALIDNKDRSVLRKQITDAQAVEMVWRHSQCVRNQTGRCPLLIFGRQLADELNEFFAPEERSGDAS